MSFQGIRGAFKQNYNLKHLTWLKVGGSADIFFKPEDIEDLKTFLKEHNNRFPITVIGAGSNLIIRDKGIEGVVIKLGRNFTDIQFVDNNFIAAGAGCLNSSLAKFCLVNAITGFEFLIGIPGTVGGGVAMNAGSYGCEFKDIVASVEVLDKEGNLVILDIDQIGFSYRANSLPKDLIFTRVFFKAKNKEDINKIKQKMDEISAIRSSSQPVSEKTGGSTFANPEGFRAWELIDKAGLRKTRVGGACMSEMHCNFMINDNNATATDMENLGELIRQKVKENSGIELQWEIKRIGKL